MSPRPLAAAAALGLWILAAPALAQTVPTVPGPDGGAARVQYPGGVRPGQTGVPRSTPATPAPTTAKQVPTLLPKAKGGCPPGSTPYDLDYQGPGTMRCRVNDK